jgi:hypothetical protein
MPPLDELYRRLLFTYPEPYRREHEAEIVSTLLEAAEPQRRWPSVREATGLLVGGLRTRALVAAREGPLAIWADGLRLGVALLLGSYITNAYGPFMFESGTRARFLPVLLVLAAIAVMRGASRAGMVLVVAAAAAAWPYVLPYAGSSPNLLVFTQSWSAYEVLSLPIAALVLLWYSWVRRSRRPWSWWLVVPVVVCPVLYEFVLTHPTYWTLQSALSFHIPLSLFELVLPSVLLVAWSTIAADPRPSIGAALYIAVHLTAVAPGVAAQPAYALPLLVPAILSAATIAGAAVSSRRLAHG